MQFNKNLSGLLPYKTEFFSPSTRRLHNNESFATILPIDVLTKDVFSDINFYPEKIYETLVEHSTKFYASSAEFTIATNGSDEGLDLIIRSLCDTGEVAVVLNPTFSMYKQYAIIHGMKVLEFNLNEDFTLAVDEFITFCKKSEAKIVFIPNPLAPTGGITQRQNLLKIIESLPTTFVIIDEAYIEFSSKQYDKQSLVSDITHYHNLIVTRTLSKFFGLAGIRLGFIFTQYKSEILKVKAPYNVNYLTAHIGVNLFRNITDEIMAQRYLLNQKNKSETLLWLEQFTEIEEIYETYANFLFIKLSCASALFAERIFKEYNFKIKNFSGQFQNFCRISF